MKKIMMFILLAVAFVSCNKSIEGDAVLTNENYTVSTEAPQIEVQSTMRLVLSDDVKPGEIEVIANQNIHNYINIINRDDKLIIDLDNKSYSNISIEIHASSAQYCMIEATGASSVITEGAVPEHKNYLIALSGASVYRGDVNLSSKLDILLSGASEAYVSGSSDASKMDISGASRVYGEDFTCNDLDVDISGASKVEANVNNTVTGKASGASTLKIIGDPTISVDLSGASTIK